MAITKEKLITSLRTQIGLDKPESRQMVERLFGLMKDTLTNGEDLLVSGFGKFLVRHKKERRGRIGSWTERIAGELFLFG